MRSRRFVNGAVPLFLVVAILGLVLARLIHPVQSTHGESRSDSQKLGPPCSTKSSASVDLKSLATDPTAILSHSRSKASRNMVSLRKRIDLRRPDIGPDQLIFRVKDGKDTPLRNYRRSTISGVGGRYQCASGLFRGNFVLYSGTDPIQTGVVSFTN
jgi:hypothetical protein